MAPIEPDIYNSNTWPLLLLGGYFSATFALTALIVRNVIYRAYISLPPSQTTRHRQSHRQKHMQTFAALAAVSLALTVWGSYDATLLSYRVWARETGESLPTGLWGQGGIFARDGGAGLELGRWMTDTHLFWDQWEIVAEKSRRFWWSQQYFLGATLWSVFTGIEGESRTPKSILKSLSDNNIK